MILKTVVIIAAWWDFSIPGGSPTSLANYLLLLLEHTTCHVYKSTDTVNLDWARQQD